MPTCLFSRALKTCELQDMFFCYLSRNDVITLYDSSVHYDQEEISLCMASLSSTHVVFKKACVLVHTLLQEFCDVFLADLPNGWPPLRGVEHAIDVLPGSKPISRPPYQLSHHEA